MMVKDQGCSLLRRSGARRVTRLVTVMPRKLQAPIAGEGDGAVLSQVKFNHISSIGDNTLATFLCHRF